MTNVRHSSQSSCLSKKVHFARWCKLKNSGDWYIIILVFCMFLCMARRHFVLRNSIYENKQTNKTKAVREFQVKDPIPFGKIVWNSKIMVLTEGGKSIVEILWLVAWYAYDSSRHVYILFNSEFLWTLAVKGMGLVSTYRVTEI